MNITREIYYSIRGKDEPGALAGITAELMEAGVELEGLWGTGSGGAGSGEAGSGNGSAAFIAVPRSAQQFSDAARGMNWDVTKGECFRLTGADRRGVLVETLRQITEQGINLQSVDAIALDGQFGCYIWAQGEDLERLGNVLDA